MDIKQLRKALLDWFGKNKRDLPWRRAAHWYSTFLSEMLLQQTQVSQALPYYRAFLKRYPTINHLAAAKEEDVLQLWAGLGYYSRARNMLKAARKIVQNYDGNFPSDYKEALSLPGIGPYSGAAILSISFNHQLAVLDGNVFRVLSRLFLIDADIRLATSRKVFQQAADKLLDPESPGAFNEAMMELGATTCLPTAPDCAQCPLNAACKAYKLKRTGELPVKSPPPAKKQWFHLVFILRRKNKIYLRRRPAQGLLARMWELPASAVTRDQLSGGMVESALINLGIHNAAAVRLFEERVHVYSHIRLSYRAALIEVDSRANLPEQEGQAGWFDPAEIPAVGLHGAHKKLFGDAEILQALNN